MLLKGEYQMAKNKESVLGMIRRETGNFSKTKRMLKGSISKIKNGFILTYKNSDNITKTLYIRKDKVSETKILIQNYNKAKQIFNRILSLNIELFKLDK